MDFTGTTGRDNYVGTVDADEFDMSQGGRDTVSGLEGDDVFIFGTELNANDQIDGGAGIRHPGPGGQLRRRAGLRADHRR